MNHLQSKQALLILDNCEHVLDEAARLSDEVLRQCPGVAMLATSRAPLATGRELIWRLDPLVVDGEHSDAVDLFIERARAVNPSFAVDPPTLKAVVGICRRLDGLPLAIELAAKRTAVLTPSEILVGLDDSLRLLRSREREVPDRQRSMEALFNWSARLLSADELKTLCRIASFSGAFDLGAAHSAVGDAELDSGDVSELVWSLAEKSLVVVESTAGATRYRLLESVRSYALRKLTADGDRAGVAGRLADWYARMLDTASAVSVDLDNLRGLVEPLAQSDPTKAQRVAHTISSHHHMVGSATAGIAEIQHMLEKLPTRDPGRVGLLADLSDLLIDAGKMAEGLQVAEAAATLSAEVGPPSWQVIASDHALAKAVGLNGDMPRALGITCAALASPTLDACSRARLLTLLSLILLELGHYDDAYDSGEQCLRLAEVHGGDTATALSNLAEIDYRRGRLGSAARLQESALTVASETGDLVTIAFSLIMAAWLGGQAAMAVRLQSKADALLEGLGRAMYEPDRQTSDNLLMQERETLGDDRYAAEQQTGRMMSIPEAIEECRSVLAMVAVAVASTS